MRCSVLNPAAEVTSFGSAIPDQPILFENAGRLDKRSLPLIEALDDYMNKRLELGSRTDVLNDHFWVFAAAERSIAMWSVLAAHRADRVPEMRRLGRLRLSRFSVFT